jgi:hypothetical protein
MMLMNMAATNTTPTATFWLILARNAKSPLIPARCAPDVTQGHAQTAITTVLLSMFLACANYFRQFGNHDLNPAKRCRPRPPARASVMFRA